MQAKLVLKNTFIDFQSLNGEEDNTRVFARQTSEPARLPGKHGSFDDEDVLSDDADTEDGGSGGKKTPSESDGPEMCSVPSNGHVGGQTLQLNNFPEHSTHQNLVDFLCDAGFHGMYDLIHVPMDADGTKHCGFAIVNFSNSVHAKAFADMMDVLKFTSSKIVVTQAPLQGYTANYDYYLGQKGFPPTKERSLPPGQWTVQAKTQEVQDQFRQVPWSKQGEQAPMAGGFVPSQRPWQNGFPGETVMMATSSPGAADAQRLPYGAASQQQLPPTAAPKRFCGWCGERRGMTCFCSRCGNSFDGNQQESQNILPTPYMALPTVQMGSPCAPVMWYGLRMTPGTA
eukprot:TRINITY_DN31101_c0_g1_i1.p1 TRINITY_DN31101_c0_g1~~TRINITY_DN31101_c0_g1_i1.p1  ORF type:complete len:398 (-),score=76.79 TRINITY_DN31101_c0_g1_i1:155-1180(-)